MLSSTRVVVVATLFASAAAAQSPAASQQGTAAAPLAPATKLEAFTPAVGTIETTAFDNLGKVGTYPWADVEAREVRDGQGNVARGLLVTITESQYKEEGSFVDADELPELVSGIDAVLSVTQNTSAFHDFQTEYHTRGDLVVSVYSDKQNLRYAMRAGRPLHAIAPGLSRDDLTKFRSMVTAAITKFSSPPAR